MTTTERLNPLAITIGLFAVAGVLLARGDVAHAMVCVVLTVPNAQQILGALRTEGPVLAAILGEIQGITRSLPSIPAPAMGPDTPTPVPPARGSTTIAVVTETSGSTPDTKK